MTVTNETTLFFNGHNILVDILSYFEEHYEVGWRGNVILAGESAGGFGVVANVDHVRDRYNHGNTRVVGAPIGGFYMPAFPYTGPESTWGKGPLELADFQLDSWGKYGKLWNSYVNEDCAEHYNDLGQSESVATCLLANITAEYIKSEMFWTEAQTDKVQITLHNWITESSVHRRVPEVLEYLEEWMKNMTSSLLNHIKDDENRQKDGVFLPNCWIHTDFYHRRGPHIDIGGGGINDRVYSYLQGFGDWFFKRSRVVDTTRLVDDLSKPIFGGLDCPDPNLNSEQSLEQDLGDAYMEKEANLVV